MYMKTMRWIVLAIVVLGATGWMLAQAEVSRKAEGEAEVRALRKQVEQLQQRLETLGGRLADVESPKPGSPPRVMIQPKSPVSPPLYLVPSYPDQFHQGQPQPKVWGQREVNGWPFYLIPCGDE